MKRVFKIYTEYQGSLRRWYVKHPDEFFSSREEAEEALKNHCESIKDDKSIFKVQSHFTMVILECFIWNYHA